ncbi:c-type cytochrome [Elongatibacter sediminis]|uniref:C-type cytochrome n=1 Tax=Elongatibacter sediminis TaxID=3119006 RepID=A0AAW9RKL5_9GAMM
MNQADDRVFLRRFSGIILGLVAVTVTIIVLAVSVRNEPDPAANPSQQAFIEERLAPVSDVRAGEAGQAALAQAAAAAAPAAAEAAGPVDGEQVYQSVCMACHAAGVAGAPIPGSDALAERLAAKGTDGLVSSAINGLNVMPPRGGRPDLTDEQIQAAVDFMLQ